MARRKHSRSRPRAAKETGPEAKSRTSDSYWLYGVHAVEAALRNPARTVFRLLATEEAAARLRPRSTVADPEIMARAGCLLALGEERYAEAEAVLQTLLASHF